jgi:hypothetical protein
VVVLLRDLGLVPGQLHHLRRQFLDLGLSLSRLLRNLLRPTAAGGGVASAIPTASCSKLLGHLLEHCTLHHPLFDLVS